jgi:hypothetical protein
MSPMERLPSVGPEFLMGPAAKAMNPSLDRGETEVQAREATAHNHTGANRQTGT